MNIRQDRCNPHHSRQQHRNHHHRQDFTKWSILILFATIRVPQGHCPWWMNIRDDRCNPCPPLTLTCCSHVMITLSHPHYWHVKAKYSIRFGRLYWTWYVRRKKISHVAYFSLLYVGNLFYRKNEENTAPSLDLLLSPFQKGRGQERLKIKGCPAKKPPTSNIRTGRSNEKQQIDFPPPAIFPKETSLSEAFN